MLQLFYRSLCEFIKHYNHFDNNVFASASLQVNYWDKEGQCLLDINFPPTGKAKTLSLT